MIDQSINEGHSNNVKINAINADNDNDDDDAKFLYLRHHRYHYSSFWLLSYIAYIALNVGKPKLKKKNAINDNHTPEIFFFDKSNHSINE